MGKYSLRYNVVFLDLSFGSSQEQNPVELWHPGLAPWAAAIQMQCTKFFSALALSFYLLLAFQSVESAGGWLFSLLQVGSCPPGVSKQFKSFITKCTQFCIKCDNHSHNFPKPETLANTKSVSKRKLLFITDST